MFAPKPFLPSQQVLAIETWLHRRQINTQQHLIHLLPTLPISVGRVFGDIATEGFQIPHGWSGLDFCTHVIVTSEFCLYLYFVSNWKATLSRRNIAKDVPFGIPSPSSPIIARLGQNTPTSTGSS